MSDLNKNDLLDKLNLTQEQGAQLLEAATNNPMEALGFFSLLTQTRKHCSI